MELYRMQAAPLTTVGVDLEKQCVMIHHTFPLSTPKEEVLSGLLNQAQGFFMARLTMPSNDVIAVGAMICAHVPDIVGTDSPNAFNQTEVFVSKYNT